jgi:hypothetical protein
MNVARLLALRTDRLYPQETFLEYKCTKGKDKAFPLQTYGAQRVLEG